MNKTQLQAKAEELGVELDGDETSAVLKAKIAEAERSAATKTDEESVTEVNEELDRPGEDTSEVAEEPHDIDDAPQGEVEIAEAEKRESEEEFTGAAGLTQEQIDEFPQGEPELEAGKELAKDHSESGTAGVVTSTAVLNPESEKAAGMEASHDVPETSGEEVLVRYKGQAGSYFIAGTRFTVREPIQAVAKEDADRITQSDEFEVVSDEEAKELYS